MALELIACADGGVFNAGFDFAVFQDRQRVGIQIFFVVVTFFDLAGIGLVEQVLVKTQLGVESVVGGYPMQRRFDLSTVGSVTASCGRVIGAVQFDDFTVGVFDDIGAGDEIRIAEPNFLAG